MKDQYSFELMLWQLIHGTLRTVDKLWDQELQKRGLSSRKAAVIRAALRLGQRATVTEISRQLFIEINTTSEQLKRMEHDGLIRKVKCLGTKNALRVEVTAKGHELYKTETVESIQITMSVLTDKEKTELWSILSKIRQKAVSELALQNMDLYPPADYESIDSFDGAT